MNAKAVFAFALLTRASAMQMATAAQMNTSKAQEDGIVEWGCINTQTAQAAYTSEGLTFCQWCVGTTMWDHITSLQAAATMCRDGLTSTGENAADLKYVSFEYPTSTSAHIKCWGTRDLEDFRKADSSSCGATYDYAGGTYQAGAGWTGHVFEITGTASAIGDPHLQNVHGERFDLMLPGGHVLINIPRSGPAENALLHVQAKASRLGGQCGDTYFTEVNVTGSWAFAKQAGGFKYVSQGVPRGIAGWIALGAVELKVVSARTASGIQYLNVYVKHLGRAGFAVGGLLGEDDHSEVSTPPAGCQTHLSLGRIHAEPHSFFGASPFSTAAGTFA